VLQLHTLTPATITFVEFAGHEHVASADTVHPEATPLYNSVALQTASVLHAVHEPALFILEKFIPDVHEVHTLSVVPLQVDETYCPATHVVVEHVPHVLSSDAEHALVSYCVPELHVVQPVHEPFCPYPEEEYVPAAHALHGIEQLVLVDERSAAGHVPDDCAYVVVAVPSDKDALEVHVDDDVHNPVVDVRQHFPEALEVPLVHVVHP